jgi:hypothetical protein
MDRKQKAVLLVGVAILMTLSFALGRLFPTDSGFTSCVNKIPNERELAKIYVNNSVPIGAAIDQAIKQRGARIDLCRKEYK